LVLEIGRALVVEVSLLLLVRIESLSAFFILIISKLRLIGIHHLLLLLHILIHEATACVFTKLTISRLLLLLHLCSHHHLLMIWHLLLKLRGLTLHWLEIILVEGVKASLLPEVTLVVPIICSLWVCLLILHCSVTLLHLKVINLLR
jgi:hypothetical protein